MPLKSRAKQFRPKSRWKKTREDGIFKGQEARPASATKQNHDHCYAGEPMFTEEAGRDSYVPSEDHTYCTVTPENHDSKSDGDLGTAAFDANLNEQEMEPSPIEVSFPDNQLHVDAQFNFSFIDACEANICHNNTTSSPTLPFPELANVPKQPCDSFSTSNRVMEETEFESVSDIDVVCSPQDPCSATSGSASQLHCLSCHTLDPAVNKSEEVLVPHLYAGSTSTPLSLGEGCGTSHQSLSTPQATSVLATSTALPVVLQTPSTTAHELKNIPVFKQCVGFLNETLPKHWSAVEDGSSILILKFSQGKGKVSQRSLHFSERFELTATWHGKELSANHSFYEEVKKYQYQLNESNPKILAFTLCQVVSQFRLFEVCAGVPQIKFKPLWHKDKECFIDVNPFKEIRYTETCRSKQCYYAVPQLQRQCKECFKVYKRFSSRAVFKAPNMSPSGRVKTPKACKSIADMITPEKIARLRRYKKLMLNLKRQNDRLRKKVECMVEEESVEVGEDMDSALTDTLQEADKNGKLTDFHKLFLQQQLKASQVKGATGMRWHPLMIRFALQLKMVSSAAYATMAKSGFIKLPGARTLFDYSHAMTITEGIHTEILEDVAKSVEACKHEYQRNHVLIFDEVDICQGLATRKNTGEVIGYSNLSKVQQEMKDLQEHIENLAAELPPQAPKPIPLVKKMLSFMVKGTASSVQSVVASFGVSSLSKEDLHNYTWEVIESLEISGIRVCALVCDGSPVNRGFISMQPPHSTDSEVVYDTVNLYAPDRVIYFISDPPHLLKTIRNCLYNSGRKKCRNLQRGGQKLYWSTIVKLFKIKSELTVKKLYKLTAPCVFLNSYSRMKVAYAARVISNSVAEVLAEMKWPGTSELSLFENF